MQNRGRLCRASKETLMKIPLVSVSLLFAMHFIPLVSAAQDPALVETDSFVIGIDSRACAVRFLDKRTGTDYCDHSAIVPFAEIRTASATFPATAAAYDGEYLTLRFADTDAEAVLRVTAERRCAAFEVVSFACEDAEEFVFGRISLTLMGHASETFAVSPLARNLMTNCGQIPGRNPSLTGFAACKRFGFTGAHGVIVAGPAQELREALKDAVAASPGLPHAPWCGPWALDAPINQGSYLIAAQEHVTEENVCRWIEAARVTGATQIDLHGGESFRFGDFEVNRAVYPRGQAGLKTVVDRIHEAGLAAGLHTFAFFIAKDTPWVTPIPDVRLASDAVLTLAEDLAEDDTAIIVEESTAAMSAVTGFQVRNSVTLRIGTELITYAGAAKQPPYAFTGCVRGAHGTRPAAHGRGAKAFHLRECFGLFVPEAESTLFEEVAQRNAGLFNACGFDMLYIDALDGADILDSPQYAWHYAAKYAYELVRRLERPAVMEMSTFSHHLWCVRSRMQAWDCPARGVKDFIDCHVAHNAQWQAAFLPTHLGWWGCFDWAGVQPDRTMPDDVEYLCAKALATGSSLSFLVGFTPGSLTRAHTQRLAAITRRYEDLRQAGTVSEALRAKLAQPGAEFILETTEGGQTQFRPAAYSANTISLENNSGQAVVRNPYGAQPLRLRIETLFQPDAYDLPGNRVLADWNSAGEFGPAATQQGVTASLDPASREAGNGLGAVLAAENTHVEPGRAWAAFTKEFAAPVSLKDSGLGLWVEGDGQGEVLNIQVRSPQHLGGGLADHYIPVDFTGTRYFALVEPESEALSQYEWAHTRRKTDLLSNSGQVTGFAYPMYHVWVDYAQIAALTVGVNNIPMGKAVQVRLGPIRALTLQKSKLKNPTVTLGAANVCFPIELETGSYLELSAPDDCKVYDARGNCLQDVAITGAVPVLAAGENVLALHADTQAGATARARVTVMMYGEPLRQ